MLVPRCVACVIDSTGTYIDGGKRNLLDDRFCGPAHQNGCDMTRNIPQPIWCIGPQKVYPRSRYSNGAPPTCRLSPVHRFSHASRVSPAASLLFCHSIFPIFCRRTLNHRSALKTDTILIIKAGCDSRTLWQTNFDGKSMPCLLSGCRYLRFPGMLHAPSVSVFSLFFFFAYGNLQATIAKYSLASLILLFKRVYGVNFPFSISPLILPIFLSL